jgi:F-box-like
MPVISTLPNELWMEVFESVNSPSDLAQVLRTCSRFRDLAIRILHRRLIWNDPRHFAQVLQFWTNNPGMVTVPRSLTVGISQVPVPPLQVERLDRAVAVVDIGGALSQAPRNGIAPPANKPVLHAPQDTMASRFKPFYLATQNLCQAMKSHMVTFTQLTDLSFGNALLPNDIYNIIHGLPSLRVLHIENCTFDQATNPGTWDHTTLPITELSLLGLEGGAHVTDALCLAKAHNLRVLRFDSSACVFRLFTRNNPYGQHIVPQHLESVDVRLPDKKSWPPNPSEAQQTYIAPLTEFLAMCPNVVRLVIGSYMPEFIFPPKILPNLRSYTGPMSTVITVTGSRPIRELNISDAGTKLSEWTGVLDVLGVAHPSLEELVANVPYWDDEILHAVTQLFRDLRLLRISYAPGNPSELCDLFVYVMSTHLIDPLVGHNT